MSSGLGSSLARRGVGSRLVKAGQSPDISLVTPGAHHGWRWSGSSQSGTPDTGLLVFISLGRSFGMWLAATQVTLWNGMFSAKEVFPEKRRKWECMEIFLKDKTVKCIYLVYSPWQMIWILNYMFPWSSSNVWFNLQFLFFFFNNYISVLGLHCCLQAFSS